MKGNFTSLRLSSNTNNICKVEHFVERLSHQYRFSPDLYCNVLVSLTEAVNNAIIHGNCLDERKCVEVRVKSHKNNSLLSLTIADEGKGFDHTQVPDPTSPENKCKCGGRGVFLMKQLADNIHFRENGRVVEMEFKCR